jgi:uncharacterized protein YuzE
VTGVSVDKDTGATYLRLRSGVVARTEELSDSIFVDYDQDGRVLGIEYLSLTG